MVKVNTMMNWLKETDYIRAEWNDDSFSLFIGYEILLLIVVLIVAVKFFG